MPYRQTADMAEWTTAETPVVTSTLTTSYASYSLSAAIPVGYCRFVGIACDPASGATVHLSFDGTNTAMAGNASVSAVTPWIITPAASVYLKTASGSSFVKVRSITLRR